MEVPKSVAMVLPTAGALVVADWLLPGLRLDPWWWALPVALTLATADLLLRPALRLLAVGAGAVPAVVAGVFVQILLGQLALNQAGSVTTWPATATALVLVSAARAGAGRLMGGDDVPYLLADLLERARPDRRRTGVTTVIYY